MYSKPTFFLVDSMDFLRLSFVGLFLLSGIAIGLDVPVIFSESSSQLASYNATQLEQICISAQELQGLLPIIPPNGKDELQYVQKKTKDINLNVDVNNTIVRDHAVQLASRFPGELNIDQICMIYTYLRNGDDAKKEWSYVYDPRGIEYLSSASETLKLSEKTDAVGAGDCDDFAILMAALIEAIGGKTRIILAFNNNTGHAYSEVYLGNLSSQGKQIDDIVSWLKGTYKTDNIYVHLDADSKEVWLNLDWQAKHPGGPFYPGISQYAINIREEADSDKVSVTGPSDPEIWSEAGRRLFNDDEYDKSLAYLNKALYLNPFDEDSWYFKSRDLHRIGEYEKSIECIDRAIELDPQDAYNWNAKGVTLKKENNFGEGLRCLEKAVELNPNCGPAWYNKADLLGVLGRYEDALISIDRGIELDPEDAQKWELKSNILYRLGKYQESIESADKALEIDPEDASAWNDKGMGFSKLNNEADALKCYTKAAELEPDDPIFWYNKGSALRDLGRDSEAEEAFSVANRLGIEK